ncbi:MAG TPA: glycosyltransferase family 1 protein [Chloroflexi bacterium]|nr:glycosyltransferase family 1 protein [Chloroflexota bacterium]
MKIVMVGPFGMRPRGTMSVRALPLAQALVARGHEVTLLLPPWQNPEASGQITAAAGVRIENLRLPKGVPGWFHLRLTLALVRRTLALQPDVVHVFKPKAYAGLTHWLLRALRRRLPVVVDTDDWEGPGGWNDLAPYPALLKRFFTWQERWGLTRASAVTVASRALETLVWSLGVPPARVCYLPNGVAWAGPPVTPTPHARPTVLLYTRFFEFGLERIWRVLWQVRDARPAVRLWVVGQGLFGEERELFALAREASWRISRKREPEPTADLVYAGWVEPTALPRHFAQVDVALYPFNDTLVNRTKCPVKLLDLLAAGIPVVGEAVGQIVEMIAPGETGLLIPPGDEPGLAWALLSLLEDAERRAQLRTRAAADVRTRFSWAQLAQVAEAAYRIAGS